MQKNIDTTVIEKNNFFPVTAYIKGQLLDIKEKGITPIKYLTINGKTDSVMLKLDSLNNAVAEFLTPEIDSTNLISLFTETKFLDQSIHAFTFSYDAKNNLPDSFLLKHWDVYIDPEKGNIKRIYIVKKTTNNKTLQLVWQNNKWCKIITLSNNNATTIEKILIITWDY